MSFKKAIFVFTYDPDNVIKGVTTELLELPVMFPSDKMSPLSLARIRQKQLDLKIGECGADLILFHFAGHASDKFLQFNQDNENPDFVNFQPFADNLCTRANNLKLIFLNGCSTAQTADYLAHQKNVPAVIGTTKKLKDEIGVRFATHFYSAFIREKKDLETAFNLAQNALKQDSKLYDTNGKIKPEAFSERGFGEDEDGDNADQNLYTLHRKDDAVLKSTFESWLSDATFHLTTAKLDADKMQSKGKDTEGYLLCNRAEQVSEFEAICQQKINGQLPDVQFLFYHDVSQDCPDLLPLRFRRFVLPQLCDKTHAFREVLLPPSTNINAADPLSNDYFKVWFTESFDKEMGSTPPNANELLVLKRRPMDERLLVIHHPLNLLDWFDRRNPARNSELETKLKAFFDWYVGTYAQSLSTDFSERLVVVITARYLAANTYLPLIFNDLASRFPNQVKNCADLLPIMVEDVDDWRQSFLDNTKLFDATQLFQNIAQQMSLPDWQNTLDLPFVNLVEPLQEKIKKYNSLIS